MNWWYVENGQQAGPVAEAELDAMVASGRIPAQTLIWREGLDNWQPYSVVRGAAMSAMAPPPPPAPSGALDMGMGGLSYGLADAPAPAEGGQVTTCAQCGRMFPTQDMVQFGNSYICAACKPTYVQRMKEGYSALGEVEYASMWQRLGARIIDGLIIMVPMIILGMIVVLSSGSGNEGDTFMTMVVFLAAFIFLAYESYFLQKTGATPGKKLAKVRVVREDGEPLAWGVSIGRACLRNGVQMIPVVGSLFSLAVTIMDFVAIWDQEHRTLPDRICKTRVIKA